MKEKVCAAVFVPLCRFVKICDFKFWEQKEAGTKHKGAQMICDHLCQTRSQVQKSLSKSVYLIGVMDRRLSSLRLLCPSGRIWEPTASATRHSIAREAAS